MSSVTLRPVWASRKGGRRSGKLAGVSSGHRLARVAVVAATLAAGGCLGTGTRRVDAPCREMRGSVAREMLRDTREIPVLDVRSSRTQRVEGAIEIPLSELPGRIGEIGTYRSLPVVVVGDDGEAGQKACEVLAGAGFKHAVFVPEGAAGLFAGVRGAADAARVPGEPQ